jgi:deoxyhypusine synthase
MVDFKKIKTIPISQRKNLVKLEHLAKLDDKIKVFKNKNLKKLSQKIVEAYKQDKHVILMMGAHVIKTGMSPYIIDLMKKGVIKHVAMNGAGSIHDFELALIGETSEDVQSNIENGTFGMAEETGSMINNALNTSYEGYGKTIGKLIHDSNLPYKDYSILKTGYELNIPVTVHVAIGTDIIHQHPSCNGEATGRATYKDFQIFTESVSQLEQGVIINLGSAILLPEVFLKALTIARNLEHKIEKFTAANIDMIDHYRPRVNVVERPTSLGGEGYFIKGKHEKTIPTLYHLIKKGLK